MPLENQHFKSAFVEQVKRILDSMKDAKYIVETILNKHNEINYPNQEVLDYKLEEIRVKMEERFIDIFKLGIVQDQLPSPLRQNKHRGYVIQALISGLLFQYVNDQTHLKESELLDLIFDEVIKTFKY